MHDIVEFQLDANNVLLFAISFAGVVFHNFAYAVGMEKGYRVNDRRQYNIVMH